MNAPSAPRPAAVSAAAARAYREAMPRLVAEVDRAMLSRADVDELLGFTPRQAMLDNHRHHAAFMATVFDLGAMGLLERTLPWVYGSYRGQGWSYDYFPVALAAWSAAVEGALPSALAAPLLAVYRWVLAGHLTWVSRAEAARAPSPTSPDPSAERGQAFARVLLGGSSREALALAERMVPRADGLRPFFDDVLRPAMGEVGERWARGEASVAQEHLASSIVARVLAALHLRFAPERPRKGRALVSAGPGEFHELGAWMVADLLLADGWDVRYLGANTPADALASMALARKPALVVLSVTMPFNLVRARETVAALRAQDELRGARIMVGGRALALDPDLVPAIGGDGTAGDAGGAVALAAAWWGERL